MVEKVHRAGGLSVFFLWSEPLDFSRLPPMKLNMFWMGFGLGVETGTGGATADDVDSASGLGLLVLFFTRPAASASALTFGEALGRFS
jgi:hypothetical protein